MLSDDSSCKMRCLNNMLMLLILRKWAYDQYNVVWCLFDSFALFRILAVLPADALKSVVLLGTKTLSWRGGGRVLPYICSCCVTQNTSVSVLGKRPALPE